MGWLMLGNAREARTEFELISSAASAAGGAGGGVAIVGG